MSENLEFTRMVEDYVLGSMMVDSSLVPLVMQKIDEIAFSNISHQLIFDAICQSYENHANTDPIIVSELLQKSEQINRAGGPMYLYDLTSKVVETDNAEHYVSILHETWIRKKISAIGEHMKMQSDDLEESIDGMLDGIQSQVFSLNRDAYSNEKTLIADNLTNVFEMILNPKMNDAVKTGYHDLDKMTNGLHNGDMIIIAARPSMGKSALATNILQNVAIDQNVPVLMFSLEMPTSQIIMRMLSNETRISFSDLRNGRLTNNELNLIVEGMTRLKYAPINIIDKRGLKVSTIKAESRKMKAEQKNLGLIVVDYVQLVLPSKNYGTREQEVADVVRSLKALAGELDVPVVICSQINRTSERAEDKRPALSSLRESGELEQTADMVAFIYRDDYYDDAEEDPKTEILIRKNRNGPTGEVTLQFNKEIMTFESLF